MSPVRTMSIPSVALSSVLALLLAACASSPGAPKETAPAPAGGAQPAVATESSPKLDGPALNPVSDDDLVAPWAQYQPVPPDGQWQVDLQGREYYLQPVPKHDGGYVRLEPTKVRVPPGVTLEIEREDDSYFYAKVYRKGDTEGPASRPEVLDADRERIAKSYEVSIPQSDVLSFVAVGAGLPAAGQWRNGFDLADVDGDGALDLIHGVPRRSMGGTPVIFRGDGKGGFARWAEATFPPYPYDYGDVAAGDFNDDGKIDLAFAMHLRGLVAMLGDGKGKFTAFSDGLELTDPAASTWSSSPFTSRAIEAIDWNGDGKDDILAVSEGPARPGLGASAPYAPGKRIYLAGETGWTRAAEPKDIDPIFGDAIAIADFNADGKNDFVTGISIAGNRAILNIAAGDAPWRVATLESIRPAAAVRGVAAADLNRDRRADLFVAYVSTEGDVARTGVDLMLSQPGGWLRIALWAREGRDGVRGMALGDLDGDGEKDLVGFTDVGEPVVLRGLSGGRFALESPDGIDSATSKCRGYSVRLADLDGDGKDEILAGFADERCASGGAIRGWKTIPATR